jgi:hypothetical protein
VVLAAVDRGVLNISDYQPLDPFEIFFGRKRYAQDLFDNFIGALTFSIIGYFYVCSRGENKFAKRFIPVANNSTRPKDAPLEAPEKNEIE